MLPIVVGGRCVVIVCAAAVLLGLVCLGCDLFLLTVLNVVGSKVVGFKVVVIVVGAAVSSDTSKLFGCIVEVFGGLLLLVDVGNLVSMMGCNPKLIDSSSIPVCFFSLGAGVDGRNTSSGENVDFDVVVVVSSSNLTDVIVDGKASASVVVNGVVDLCCDDLRVAAVVVWMFDVGCVGPLLLFDN